MSNDFSMAILKHGKGNIVLLADTLSGNSTNSFYNVRDWRNVFNYLCRKKDHDILNVLYSNYRNYSDFYYYKHLLNVSVEIIEPEFLVSKNFNSDILVLNGNSIESNNALSDRLNYLILNGLNLIICCPTSHVYELDFLGNISFENELIFNKGNQFYWTSSGFSLPFYRRQFLVSQLSRLDQDVLDSKWIVVMSSVEWTPPESTTIFDTTVRSEGFLVYDTFMQDGIIKIT